MSDATKNPFDQMIELGQDWAKAFNPALNPALADSMPKGFEDLWQTMPKEAMESFMGKTFNPEGLDAKTKLLLTLTGLTIQGSQADVQIRLTVRHALEAGATEQEISETIALAGMFGGAPAMTRAMELARGAMDKTRETTR